MLAWSEAIPSQLQTEFQTQLQPFGGQPQSQTLGQRSHYVPYGNWLAETPQTSLTQRRAQADLLFRRIGITFTVCGEGGGTEQLIPFDATAATRAKTTQFESDQPSTRRQP